MAVLLSGTGGLFTRLGSLFKTCQLINTFRGTTIAGRVGTLAADLTSNDPTDAATLNTALTGLQSGSGGFLTSAKAIAQNVVIAMVNADSPQVDSTFPTAMTTLLAQMAAASQTVQRCTVGIASAASGSNAGNPVIVATVLGSNGLPMENQFAETIAGVCTSDSQSGGATALREPILFKGQLLASDTLATNYPAGSGASLSISCVDALQNQAGGTGNYLNNGSLETFATTPNVPDAWHALVGTPGTQMLQSGAAYDGTYALEVVGDGTTLTAIYQAFGVDTSVKLKAGSVYAVCLWARVDVAPASGVLEVGLTDGNNAVTVDANGANNALTRSLTTLGTTYVPITAVFRTPRVLPASLRLRIRLSTALSAGSNLYLDRVAFAAMQQFYQQGPALAVFSGSTPLVQGDSFTVTASNNYGGLLQRACDALLPMKANGFLLPSAATSPTISDSLVA